MNSRYTILTELLLILSKTELSSRLEAERRIRNILSLLFLEDKSRIRPTTQDLYISGIFSYMLEGDKISMKAETIIKMNEEYFQNFGFKHKWVLDSFQKAFNRFNKLISSNDKIFNFTRKDRNKYHMLVISKILSNWLLVLIIYKQVRLGIISRKIEISVIEKRFVSVLAYVLIKKKTALYYLNQEIELILIKKIELNWEAQIDRSYSLKETIEKIKDKKFEEFIENRGIKSREDQLANFGIKVAEIIDKDYHLDIIERTKSYLISNIDFKSEEAIENANKLIKEYEKNLEKVGEKIEEIGVSNFIWFVTYYIVLLAMFIGDRVDKYEIDTHQLIHTIQQVRFALIDHRVEHQNIEFILYYYYAELMKSIVIVENILDEPYAEAMEYFSLAYYLKDRIEELDLEFMDVNYIYHDLIVDYHTIKLLILNNLTCEDEDQRKLSQLELHYVYQAMVELDYHFECAIFYEDELSEKFSRYLRLTLEILIENDYNGDRQYYVKKMKKYFDNQPSFN
jgi:hypothetical protein